jgi:hypothetical protein
MTEKSHVGMGFHVCPVCGKEHDEVVLLDRRLRNTLTNHMFAGWSMCEEHQKLRDDGYIALIETSNRPTGLADAVRTGQLAHISSGAYPHFFNSEPPPGGIAFVEVGVIAKLQEAITTYPKD